MNFQEMDIKTLEGNPWKMIGDDWMLVAAKKDGQVNAMTASWAAWELCGARLPPPSISGPSGIQRNCRRK